MTEMEKFLLQELADQKKQNEKLQKMIRELEYKRNLKKPLAEMESIRDVYSVLLAILRTDAEKYVPGDRRQKITPAIEYISRHYFENITNDTLASLVGVSNVYFRKMFTAAMGVPPMTYARRIRIEKAKEMLKSDYGTLSDIAQSLGYANLYDFSRDFKKHTGVPPSKYQD